MSAEVTIILICSLVALCGALLGPLLILRKMSMMTDAISHTILFGIAMGFLLFKTQDSALMIVVAGLTGVLTVWLSEAILRTKLVKEDASIGIVFPALFSIGVILISRYLTDIHIDIDTALVGEVVFAPFDTVMLGNIEISRGLLTMGILTVIDVAFIVIFYKELKLVTFDAGLAVALGFAPVILRYALMTLLSVTAVGAFDAVGAVLFVGFVVIPASAAYLLTDRLERMMGIAFVIGIIAVLSGYAVALRWDASISGCIVMMLLALFVLVLVFAPHRGLLAKFLLRRRQRWTFAEQMLVVHLHSHEGRDDQNIESAYDTVHEHLHWDTGFAREIVRRARQRGWIEQIGDALALTERGRQAALQAVSYRN